MDTLNCNQDVVHVCYESELLLRSAMSRLIKLIHINKSNFMPTLRSAVPTTYDTELAEYRSKSHR